MTSLSERLVTRIATTRRRGTSRRGFLGGAVLAGAALAVNPWDFITKPIDAYAATCGTDAYCGAGYSVFCCTINGGRNVCPPNTYPGGWWKADNSSFCGGRARYYIDCNALPGHSFTCRCNTTGCDHRLVACNWFRYGQCNTQIKGVTPVVCRQISCRPPWQVYTACGTSSATDNNTAGHTAPCLDAYNSSPFPPSSSQIWPGHWIEPGHWITSTDLRNKLVMATNGNLALYNQQQLMWASNTAWKAAGGKAYMHNDGSLLVLDKYGHVAWSTNTHAAWGTAKTILRDDGNLVVQAGSTILWSTGTRTP